MRHTILVLMMAATALGQPPADEFLHALYDSLHNSPTQRRFREQAPMPFGVVFLPWAGMTEAQMREHFRTMKRLGFHNLKQTMPSPEWPAERILEVALEEGVIPFWYADAGWEPVTPALIAKLGIPAGLTKKAIREHPKMIAYQTGILRRQIAVKPKDTLGEAGAWRHTPDPFLRDYDVPRFSQWLRRTYKDPEAVNRSWNLYEPGHVPDPFKTWAEVDAGVVSMQQTTPGLRGFGREYSRVRDILIYKAESRATEIRSVLAEYHRENPLVPTRTGGEMGLFLPFAWRATNMEWLADTQRDSGSFYPSIHFVWHFGEVNYEVARPLYMQVSFANDLFKGGWSGAWESTGGPQQLSGAKGWDEPERSTIPGFTVSAGTITQQFLSYLAGGFKGAGVWTWNYRQAGIEAGEYALLERTGKPGARAVRAGQIAQAAERFRDELWQAHKEPTVGVLLNWDSDAIWAAQSVINRDLFRHYPMKARVGVSRALINGNVPFEYVTVDDLRAGLAGRYKSIYLPAQLALTDELLTILTSYVDQGGRVVMDAPGGWYDERGKVFPVGQGSRFEKLFGVEIAEFYYSNNVPRRLNGATLDGFVYELRPTTARVVDRFQTAEAAQTENALGKGTAVILAHDASYAAFAPGNSALEARIRQAALGTRTAPYACEGAIVYRLAAPEGDHYFFINDGPATRVVLNTKGYRYSAAVDAISGDALPLRGLIDLEANSGRWIRFAKN
jgi:beta-galactosidase